ncbi:hypothetical protein FH972_027071 [Carpinus fangiana]|uniref:Uncharacterized protein n=1 Tax=Carpinus fangiana TaxID=176857 RepID=A0A5N6L5X6_9ROSI|nr:hypothetical protein FH972_027071 [Carpinus fangiana]
MHCNNQVCWDYAIMTFVTSGIQASFRGGSLLISQVNCCKRESSTPWLNGRGTIDKIAVDQPERNKKEQESFVNNNFQVPVKNLFKKVYLTNKLDPVMLFY